MCNQSGGEVGYVCTSIHLQAIYKGTLIATFQNNSCAALLIILFLRCIAFWEVLQYLFTRTSDPNFICDIQDGCLYKDLQKPGKFLSYSEHTGLILNTDAVAVFKSSKHSLWPIYLAFLLIYK